MKIALDISQIVYAGTGVARFTNGLVRSICLYDKTNEWIFFCSSLRQKLDPEIEDLIKKRGFKLSKPPLPPKVLSYMWNTLHLFSIDLWIGKVDWLITSDWTEPPSKNKKATIIHDFVFLKYPETVDALIRTNQQKRLDWIKKESSLVFVDSESTKKDFLEYVPTNNINIVVNYPGVEKATNTQKSKVQIRPFILTVGKLEPRKNIERLIQAFNLINRPDMDLVIVGLKGWGNVSVDQNERIKTLGFVSDDELQKLYNDCVLFVMPSLYEGFGYPVLEAMQHGAPVAASQTSSLTEIVGEAGVLFDPLNQEHIAEALSTLLNDGALRKKLAKIGRVQAKKFTWKQHYNTLITSLERYK